MIRELWLKVENVQKYLEEEQTIMHVLSEKEAEREVGHRVVVYVADTRNIKKLKCWVLVDESLINDIEQILGDESVKVVQKEEPEEEIMRAYIDEMCCVPGTDENTRLELMKIQRLDRIADVLEDINGALISMGGDIEALGACVVTDSFGDRYLRISGSVYTGA